MFVARTPLLLGLLGIANVDAFASAPNTLEDMTARMVSGLIEDFAAVSANFGEDSVETVAKAVINSTPELNSYVLKIMSHMTGMEAWRTGVPPNDALISKFWDEESWHVTETVKIDKITETIYNAVSPEATSYLYRNDDLTLVKEMIDFPTTSNSPEDVTFDLPTAVAYTGPSDLYYMPLTDLASLIQSKTVSCVTVVTAFKERLEEFDPYLAFVTTPLYDSALTTAAEYDELLAAGESKGPLMCIPFGMKDHHQIADEPTSYGNILFYKSKQTVPSTVVHQLMSYGAIPIAKMTMGSLAWGPVHGWGQTMSPTLMADSGGSSTGSGSAVSVGALPFAVSEETWGSIASPSARNLISGHIPSYGGTSRGGAGLLSSETDHIGFHTRHLKDFSLLYNYMRTGIDPLDGDTVAIEMKNPAQMDLSTIKVLIVEGDFAWAYNNETGSWGYAPGSVPASYGGLSAWKWPERVERIKGALSAAGIPYETKNMTEMAAAFEDFSLDPLYPDPSIGGNVMGINPQEGTTQAFFQEFQLALINSKYGKNAGCPTCGYPKNYPAKTARTVQYLLSHFGSKFL